MSKQLMFAKVVLASQPTNGAPPIWSIHGHYPRPIHGEVMTHRVFGRNARSSRAVPVRKMLEEVRNTPYVPWHWGANQPGMKAGAVHDALIPVEVYKQNDGDDLWWRETVMMTNEEAWLHERDNAAAKAEAFMNAGYHKQNPNRLLEPFSWIHTLITSTQWNNFFWLRDHEDAEPHFHDFAVLVKEAMERHLDEHGFQKLEPGQWHLPYVTPGDTNFACDYLRAGSRRLVLPREIDPLLKKISAARCARISYAPFDGDASFDAELRRYQDLVGGSRLHASPTEHQATPDVLEDHVVFDDEGHMVGPTKTWAQPELAGNLGPGYIQFRKTFSGEYVPG